MINGDPNAYLGSADSWATFCSVLVCVALCLGLVAAVEHRVLGSVAIGVQLFLVFVGVGLLTTITVGPFFLGGDGVVYDAQAVHFAKSLGGEVPSGGLTAGKEGWPAFLGLIYFLVGRVPLVGIIIGCAATSLTAILVAGTAARVWGGYSSRRLAIYFLATPLFVLLGPSLMREALCWLGTAMVTYGLSARMSKTRTVGYLTLPLGFLLLFAVRTSLGIMVLVLVPFAALLVYLITKKRFLSFLLLCIAGGAGLLYLIIPILSVVGLSDGALTANRQYLTQDADTGFEGVALGTGPIGLAVAALQSVPRLVLGPYPWEVSASFVWVWVVANSTMWLLVLGIASHVVLRAQNRAVAATLLLGAGLVLLGMALPLTNYGIVVRMRGIPMTMILPIVVASAGAFPSRRNPKAGQPVEVPVGAQRLRNANAGRNS